MGLDIYLTRFENFDEAQRLVELVKSLTTAVWNDTTLDSDAKWTKDKAIRAEYGFSEYNPPGVTSIRLDSEIRPDHYFKVGYFRSSYNDSGIENICRQNFGVPALGSIFLARNDYHVWPNWEEAKIRALELADRFDSAQRRGRNLVAFHVTSRNGKECNSVDLAIRLVNEQLDRESPFDKDSGYWNQHGFFSPKKPLEVVAVLPSDYSLGAFDHALGRQGGAWIVTRANFSWYSDALRIVAETCDYVLSKPDPEKYCLRWSG